MRTQLLNENTSQNQSTNTIRTILLTVFVAFLLIANSIVKIQAASPESAVISPTDTTFTWNGTATGGGALNGPEIGAEDLCQEGISCDTFTLTLSGSPADWAGKRAHIEINWLLPASDYDLYVHKDSNSGPVVATSGAGATNPTGPLTSEKVDLDPATVGTGVFTVRVVYYAATSADQYKGTVSVTAAPTESTPGVSTEPAPRFSIYQAPAGMGQGAGEPTIGANWATGNAFMIAGLETLRVNFDDSSSPAKATWTDVSAPTTSVTTLDPILFTDSDAGATRTNRLFVSQLAGKASLMAFSDDEGATWTPSQGSGINSGVDHQTLGGGPYAKNADGSLKGGAVQLPGADGKFYPHAVYYASQDIGLAQIARSDNGGLTFGVAVPMWNLTQCGGLHGHIKVAPDGTVYVPIKGCTGNQAVAVSEDNGLTWEVRKVPGSQAGKTDPSLGFGADGTVYFGYANGDGHARTAVSRDKGRTWVNDQDVGAQLGVQNTVFAAVVGGDADRAAFFFLGTETPGAAGIADDAGPEPFAGVWYGYISTTYDGGKSWVTTNVTPNDPVQRGVVCTNGTTCPSGTRNLLDFNDLTIDKQGRPMAVFADGCTSSGCIQGVDKNADGKFNTRFDNDGTEIGTIIRQSGGKTLFAAYDSAVTNVPAAPMLTVSADTASSTGADLTWSTPDNGGSVITGYKIYRGTNGGAASLIATVGDVNSFRDASGTATNYYQVSAFNANGEGARSTKVSPAVIIKQSACQLPGVTVIQDASDAAPNTPLQAPVNINTLSIAEPFANGVNKLVFTMKVGAGALPANSQWYILWNRLAPDANHDRNYVAMKTNLSGVATFEHGRLSYPLVYTAPATNQGNLPTKFGSVEGAYDAATGTITITVTNDKIDNIGAGQSLQGLEARTFLARPDGLPINQNTSSDFAAGSSYELAGNASCQQKPATPTGLSATVRKINGRNEVVLSWTDNSNNEQNFVIERSTSVASGFVEIGTVGTDTKTYTDQAVVRKSTYYYRVRAANQSSSSDYSNTTSATIK